MKRMVIAGGTGFLGRSLVDEFKKKGWDITILTRGVSETKNEVRFVHWDATSVGEWTSCLEDADVLINLNGKSVDCRYTEKNKSLIYSTRLDATHALGKAITQCSSPPKVWMNAASATIYRHSLDREMDEYTGEIGSGFSVDVCQKWEAAFQQYDLPPTRKIILRTGIVLGRQGGPLKPLTMLARLGVGGRQANGNQFFSWLHATDFCHIVEFLIDHPETSGVYNVTAPQPIPNSEVMRELRSTLQIPFGLPLPQWLLEIGAFLIRTETELILKSRRVIPRRLEEAGYTFQFGNIREALLDLTKRT